MGFKEQPQIPAPLCQARAGVGSLGTSGAKLGGWGQLPLFPPPPERRHSSRSFIQVMPSAAPWHQELGWKRSWPKFFCSQKLPAGARSFFRLHLPVPPSRGQGAERFCLPLLRGVQVLSPPACTHGCGEVLELFGVVRPGLALGALLGIAYLPCRKESRVFRILGTQRWLSLSPGSGSPASTPRLGPFYHFNRTERS